MKRPVLWIAGAFIISLVTSGFPAPATGQQQSAPSGQTSSTSLQHEVSVVLKLIHVYVTDRKGNPIPDLAIGDISITDNGQPVKVTEFEKHVLQAAVPLPAGKPLESPTRKGSSDELAAGGLNRKFFLFIDFAHNNARGISKARKAAAHFLTSEVAPEDEVALLSYSLMKGLVVHEYLSTDHPKVLKAVGTVGQGEIVGRAEEVEQQYWQQATEGLRDADNSRGAALPSKDLEIAETTIRRWESKQIAQTFLLRMSVLAKALRLVPGQKEFIFFSSGIPGSLLYGNQAGTPSQYKKYRPTNQGSLFETGDAVLRSKAEEVNKEFGASGCTFYIFDTRESAMKTSMFERDSQTLESGNRSNISSSAGSFEANSIFKSDSITGLAPLSQLAYQTGGRYFSNIDTYEKNLGLVQAITGTYYVLGFLVNEQWDGKYHEVKVEVKREDCEVRAQAGYFNPKPFSEYSDLEKQIHLFDLALNERAFSRLPVNVPMVVLTARVAGEFHLGVMAKVSAEVTAKLTGTRVEFVAIFINSGGDISDVVRQEADPSSVRGHELAFFAGASLAPGDYSCRLVIRDLDTGLSAVSRARGTVPKEIATGIQMGSPLILEPRSGGSFLCAGKERNKEAYAWTEIYSYNSALLSPAIGELSAKTASVEVIIPIALPAGGRPDLALSAYLISAASGRQSPINILHIDSVQNGPLETLILECFTADIEPGTYFIHFYAQDNRSGLLGHTYTTLTIPIR